MEEAAMKFGKARKEVFERGGYLWAMENTSIKRVLNRAKKQSADMDVVAEMRIE